MRFLVISLLIACSHHHANRGDDDLAEGQACTGTPEACDALQGTGCGQIFECKAGHWDGHRNTCYEIP